MKWLTFVLTGIRLVISLLGWLDTRKKLQAGEATAMMESLDEARRRTERAMELRRESINLDGRQLLDELRATSRENARR